MQVDVADSLAGLLAILQEDLVGQFVDLLQFATYFLRRHKEVDAFDLSQLLQLGHFPPRTHQDVPPRYWLVVDDGEDVLTDEEDLSGRDVSHSEDDIA